MSRRTVVATLAIWVLFAVFWGRDYLEGWSLQSMIDGTGPRPFVYRQLVPMIVQLTTPAPGLYWPAAWIVTGLFLVGFSVTFPLLCREVGVRCETWWVLATLPLFFIHGGMPYDAATLFFAALLPYLIFCGRKGLFVAAFAAACLNRETTILFLAPLVLYRRSLREAIVPGAVWTVIYGFVWLSFSQNPGASAEFNLLTHLQYPSLAIATGAVITGLLFVMAIGTSRNDRLVVGYPIALALVVMYGLFGFPLEWRAFLEIVPLGSLMIVNALEDRDATWQTAG